MGNRRVHPYRNSPYGESYGPVYSPYQARFRNQYLLITTN